MMEKVCHIMGAGEDFSPVMIRRPGDIVIAADGGLCLCRKIGETPDHIIGDFDSLGYVPEGNNVAAFSPEKDDTDTLLAVKRGLSLGFRVFSINGALGGRLDHTLANIQTLSFIAGQGGVGFLTGKSTVVTAVKDETLVIPAGREGYISLFCASGTAEGVSIKGLKYELSDAVLTGDVPLGVSNEFIGEKAEISVKRGVLTVIWSEERFDAGAFLEAGKC